MDCISSCRSGRAATGRRAWRLRDRYHVIGADVDAAANHGGAVEPSRTGGGLWVHRLRRGVTTLPAITAGSLDVITWRCAGRTRREDPWAPRRCRIRHGRPHANPQVPHHRRRSDGRNIPSHLVLDEPEPFIDSLARCEILPVTIRLLVRALTTGGAPGRTPWGRRRLAPRSIMPHVRYAWTHCASCGSRPHPLMENSGCIQTVSPPGTGQVGQNAPTFRMRRLARGIDLQAEIPPESNARKDAR